MQDEPRIFSSFREAEEADADFYASLSPQDRVDMLLELIARHRESIGEAAERFERVYRVTELSRS
jgi:predicted transcriptional regulator